jgi:predicted nucleic acid-binding protein
MIRTFCDSGVLIAAARSLDVDGQRALRFLEDPDRVFLTSPFVHLEVVPKAIFFKKRLERAFYEAYFKKAVWFREVHKIEAVAQAEAAKAGLGAMDALHLAAAHLSGARMVEPFEARHLRFLRRCAETRAVGRLPGTLSAFDTPLPLSATLLEAKNSPARFGHAEQREGLSL